MDKSSTTHQNRPVWERYGKVRVSLVLIVLASVMVSLWLYGATSEQTIYACNDVETNPPDVVKQCQHLTKHQWWGTYYQGTRK